MPAVDSSSPVALRSSQAVEYVGASGDTDFVRHEAADVRVASLDGLRAIAILLVIAHNTGSVAGGGVGLPLKLWVVICNVGWVGVQLFFALSGFLITRILLDGKGKQNWLRSFYARRLLRIVPLYYALLAVVFFLLPHAEGLRTLADAGTTSPRWYWLYLANWSAPYGGNPHALPHVWSLSVEEQFYLLWPIVIAYVNDRTLARIAVGTIVVALLARVATHVYLPEQIATGAAYTWTICRADAIALGGLVALALRSAAILAWWRAHLRTVMIAAVAAVALEFAVQRSFASGGLVGEVVNQPLSGLLSALLVFCCVCGRLSDSEGGRAQTWLQRGLSAPFLTSIGKYSYAIYVIHLPLHLLIRDRFKDILIHGSGYSRLLAVIGYTGLVFAASYALARVTWLLIEQPFLALKRYFPMPARP